MTTTDDFARSAYPGTGKFVQAARGVGEAVASAFREWRAARALSRLDDLALKDLGVSRGNIDWVVREGRREGR